MSSIISFIGLPGKVSPPKLFIIIVSEGSLFDDVSLYARIIWLKYGMMTIRCMPITKDNVTNHPAQIPSDAYDIIKVSKAK